MNTYETTFIISPVVPQEKAEALLERVKKIITSKDGQIILFENEGVKKLAYEIRGQNEGNYIFMEYSAGGEVIKELETFLRLNESVLRYLTVIKRTPRKIKAKKTKKSTRVQESTSDVVPPAEVV